MRLRPWVKMGFKVMVVSVVALIFVQANSNSIKVETIEVDSLNETLSFNGDLEKEWEDINKDPYATKATYTGDLTGYAADCPKCYGTLGCKPSYKVYKNGVVTYPDKTYGNVRIVASSKKLKCGSVIRFNTSRVSKETTYAIVLDRGVLGRDIDLLMATQEDARVKIGRSKLTYEVVRFGW